MCAWLEVSRSGYYAWRGAEPSQRSKDDSALIAVMKKIYAEARGNPGVRRMRAGLAALGHLVSHKRVRRLMQAAGLRGRHPKAWKRTTICGDRPVPAPDLIGRDFTAALVSGRDCRLRRRALPGLDAWKECELGAQPQGRGRPGRGQAIVFRPGRLRWLREQCR
jgi:HTH-like domain